ncbi:ATP-binding cassette domain-containing protein [Thalassospira sp. MA62]|nr:ATP-binding cassette domain-containing protein [Thalassospira sp. MA62]
MAASLIASGVPLGGDSLGSLLNAVRYDGMRKLLHMAGADITAADMSSILNSENGCDFNSLAEMALTLSMFPKIETSRLADLLLRENLFAFEMRDGQLLVFVPGQEGDITCIAPDSGLEQPMPDLSIVGRALVLDEIGRAGSSQRQVISPKLNWLKIGLSVSRNSVFLLACVVFFASMLALALPLFTLAVYDQVLPVEEIDTLWYLSGGLFIATVAEYILKTIRSRILAQSGAFLDLRLSAARNLALLRMPVLTARRFNSRAASAIIGDHERLSNVITGPIGTAVLEIPIVIAYICVLGILIGWFALIPPLLLAVGFVLILRVLSYANVRTRNALKRADEYGQLCEEFAKRRFYIKREGGTASWLRRFASASARLAEAEMQRQRTFSYARIAANAMTFLIVTASLASGALLVMDGSVSAGTLIAVVAIVWRMMTPVPSLLEAVLRREEIGKLIETTSETTATLSDMPKGNAAGGHGTGIEGRISCSAVLFNYQTGQAPALRNLSVEIQSGEMIVVTGASGSGKSTFLDMIAGLISPQLGAVTIDGVLPSQISQSVLLQSVSYIARDMNLLPLGIREFVGLGRAEISDDEFDALCKEHALYDDIARLPDGADTRLSDLPHDSSLLRRINFMRGASSGSRLFLIDEPDASSSISRKAFIAATHKIRETATIVMVTNEPEYISVADRILVMSQGAIVRDCKPRDIADQRKVVQK